MSTHEIEAVEAAQMAGRTRDLFESRRFDIFRQTDHLFAVLLLLEWLAAILVAVLISPLTWAGEAELGPYPRLGRVLPRRCHRRLPRVRGIQRPGEALTRHAIAAGQMLMGALLIHLTGGRIETHFHVFGSLAFLAFYRDWRVLVTASVVVVIDHLFRGIYWPRSIFGVS